MQRDLHKWLRGRWPGARGAKGHRSYVADVDGVPIDPTRAPGVLRVEKLEPHVPAVAVQAAEGALFDLDVVQLHTGRDGIGKDVGSLEGV